MRTISPQPPLGLGPYRNSAQKGENLTAQWGQITCPSFLVVKFIYWLQLTGPIVQD